LVRPHVGGLALSDYGVWLKVRDDDLTYRFCRDGSYGYYFADFLAGLREPFALLDIGANIGLYSLLALKNEHCRHAVAFEPMRETADLLRANLQAQSRPDWTVIQAAVSVISGAGFLHAKEGHSGGAMLEPRVSGPFVDCGGSRVQHDVDVIGPMDLADIIAQFLDDDVLIVAKIDVEGHEADVLEALLAGESSRMSAAWIEFSAATDVPRAERLLQAAGLSEHDRVGSESHYDGLWLRRP
jgi:FkbM family methyltransferase